MYVIEWSQNDSFWAGNILSTSKLRAQFDQLVTKIKLQNNKTQNNKQSNNKFSAMENMLNKIEGGVQNEISGPTNNRVLISEVNGTF